MRTICGMLSNDKHSHHDMQEVESSVLSQAAMRAIGRYEMGWLQALVTQDAPNQAPKLAFAAQADEDEGTQGGIFIGGAHLPLHCLVHLRRRRCGACSIVPRYKDREQLAGTLCSL